MDYGPCTRFPVGTHNNPYGVQHGVFCVYAKQQIPPEICCFLCAPKTVHTRWNPCFSWRVQTIQTAQKLHVPCTRTQHPFYAICGAFCAHMNHHLYISLPEPHIDFFRILHNSVIAHMNSIPSPFRVFPSPGVQSILFSFLQSPFHILLRLISL